MKRILASIMVSALPLTVLAQQSFQGGSGLTGLLTWFRNILSYAIPIIIALAVVWFIFNIFRYAIAGNEDDKAKAKTEIIWGLIGLFVMVSVWGLVNFLASTFQLDNQGIRGPVLPTF